jgi:hypothetical protein
MDTNIQTFFTTTFGTSLLLYAAEDWVNITLRLETAGPVTVSTREDVVPVLSGKGRLLPTDTDVTFTLPRGDRLFIAAESVQRVAFTVEPVPWLGQILMAMDKGFGALVQSFIGIIPGLGGILPGIGARSSAAAPSTATALPGTVSVPSMPGAAGAGGATLTAPVPCPPGLRPWKRGA